MVVRLSDTPNFRPPPGRFRLYPIMIHVVERRLATRLNLSLFLAGSSITARVENGTSRSED